VIIACSAAAAKRRAASGPLLTAKRVLWIAAHPDDEIVPAPLLGRLCVEERADCTFLVTTRGENGICALPGGCGDLGLVRVSEMRESAAIFGAALIQWTLPDAMNDVAQQWAATAGGREPLIGQIRDVIRSTTPDLIITFDPAHGTSCHPAHREIASLALEAAEGLAPVLLLETATRSGPAGYEFRNALPDRAWSFDGERGWDYSIRAASAHRSQFTPAAVDSLRATPASERRVWVLPATARGSGGYDVACE
ncbi:MAG: PIG-L family deacetylase, partial [Thermoanaerobaculia bacterium]|nr:PIG-L family deacetylase [Thermoanaerobaculia bacterium]